jgi:hypothetical protein
LAAGDLFGSMLKDMLRKGISSGTETMIAEAAENMPLEVLDKLIVLLSKVRDKKKNVVEARP